MNQFSLQRSGKEIDLNQNTEEILIFSKNSYQIMIFLQLFVTFFIYLYTIINKLIIILHRYEFVSPQVPQALCTLAELGLHYIIIFLQKKMVEPLFCGLKIRIRLVLLQVLKNILWSHLNGAELLLMKVFRRR